jgi:hypothetical protein
MLLTNLLFCVCGSVSPASAGAFVFNVSDGGGATLTVGPAKTSTFYMQSQFSEPLTDSIPLWTTLQPPWGGVPTGFVVDRSGEAQGRTVVRLRGDRGLWSLERIYQVEHHRILVNDTLSVAKEVAAAGWEALPIHVRQIMAAEVIGSIKQLVLPGSLYTYDCNSINSDRGSFGAPQMWMATETAAVGMMPLDDVFRAHGVGFNAALAKYPRSTTQTCAVSSTERPSLTLADPHLGLAPGSSVTLEWSIYPFAEDQLDYLDFVNVLRSDLGTDQITIPHLGQLGWARCTDLHLHPCTTAAFSGAGRDPEGHPPTDGDGFLEKHWEEWSPATTRAVLKQQGKIAVTDNEDWFYGTCGEVDIDGTAFVWGMPPLFEEYLRNVTTIVNAGGGLPAVYMHTQISTGNDACNTTVPPANGSGCILLDDATNYASCRVINASGGQVHYATCAKGASLPLFYPTHKNAYGDVMRRYVEKVFTLGFKGIFHDEFGPSLVSYTYDQYDGVSVMMDRNNNLTAKVAHIGLLKDKLELELWKDITMRHGGFLLANGAPQTRTWIDAMVGAVSPSVHFGENSVEHRALFNQAYTPLMLNRYQDLPRGTDDDPKYAGIGADVWLNVLAHLDQGVLSFSYDGMWQNSTRSTCYEKMVPITVTQLGRGFIVGRERVISKVNRTFAPPSLVSPAATINYYEQGLLVRTEKVAAGASSITLTLKGPVGSATQQMGIIVWGVGVALKTDDVAAVVDVNVTTVFGPGMTSTPLMGHRIPGLVYSSTHHTLLAFAEGRVTCNEYPSPHHIVLARSLNGEASFDVPRVKFNATRDRSGSAWDPTAVFVYRQHISQSGGYSTLSMTDDKKIALLFEDEWTIDNSKTGMPVGSHAVQGSGKITLALVSPKTIIDQGAQGFIPCADDHCTGGTPPPLSAKVNPAVVYCRAPVKLDDTRSSWRATSTARALRDTMAVRLLTAAFAAVAVGTSPSPPSPSAAPELLRAAGIAEKRTQAASLSRRLQRTGTSATHEDRAREHAVSPAASVLNAKTDFGAKGDGVASRGLSLPLIANLNLNVLKDTYDYSCLLARY